MIPKNKKFAVLHPYLIKKWWAVNMMIYLSNFLSKDNNVVFYTFSYDEMLFPITENNFLIKYFKNSKLISLVKISYNIRNSDYIIIWNSPMHFVWVISKLLFRSKAKLIWRHHHYPWYYCKNANVYIRFKKIIERLVLKNIDSIVVNSKYLQASIKDIYKIDSKILYPVLGDKFLNYNSENKKILSDHKIMFTYWRWSEGKNIQLIFNTYEDLKNKVPNLILKIWWDWNELSEYKNKYVENKNIHFLWIVDQEQIIRELELSNLFLFPSKIDSFWLVILESMAIWNPVISYNLAWAKEIIKNWINWYLVDSDSEFIKRSLDILNDSSLRERLWIEAIKTSKHFWRHTFKTNLEKLF